MGRKGHIFIDGRALPWTTTILVNRFKTVCLE